MSTVTGNAQGVRDLGRSWGQMAHAADADGARLRQAASSIGVANFKGGAGDRMRAYVDSLQSASDAMASAYNKVASRAPRVADAIEHAKDAEKARDEAKDRVAKATTAVSIAQTALTAATAAVTRAQAGGLVGMATAGLIGAPTGPTPAQ